VGGSPDADFFRCWTRLLVGGLRAGDTVLSPAIEMSHHHAANYLARKFLKETDCDSVLFVDDDMCFDPTALSKMRDDEAGAGLDGQMALVLSRTHKHKPLTIRSITTSEGQTIFDYPDTWPDKGMVHGVLLGLGFTLYKRRAFDHAKDKDNPFRFTEKYGEDTAFANDVLLGGGKCAVNCNVRCGHRMRYVVYPGQDNNIEYALNWVNKEK
jgi:hypothetical protein